MSTKKSKLNQDEKTQLGFSLQSGVQIKMYTNHKWSTKKTKETGKKRKTKQKNLKQAKPQRKLSLVTYQKPSCKNKHLGENNNDIIQKTIFTKVYFSY